MSKSSLSVESSFLYPEPSFMDGISFIADFSDLRERYLVSGNEKEADLLALSQDWIAVGKDLCVAVNEVELEASLV